MSVFDIDYDGLVWQSLPTRLRHFITYGWLKALVSPVKWLYNLFTANRANNLYLLVHDGQICYLQAALNDLFDPVSRGIFISDGPFEDPLFIYLEDEDKPVWLRLVSEAGATPYPDPEPLFLDSETYAEGIGFIVNVPVAVVFDMARLKALVDFYRLPGKTYSVITF